ncbi:hypothetical protein BBJ28_00026739, partial [Nothophytophthora sp. Chile5]
MADRFVPVIKMKIDGVAVDLLFASLNVDSVPEDLDILDDGHLRDLGELSVGSHAILFSFRVSWSSFDADAIVVSA